MDHAEWCGDRTWLYGEIVVGLGNAGPRCHDGCRSWGVCPRGRGYGWVDGRLGDGMLGWDGAGDICVTEMGSGYGVAWVILGWFLGGRCGWGI